MCTELQSQGKKNSHSKNNVLRGKMKLPTRLRVLEISELHPTKRAGKETKELSQRNKPTLC